MSRYGTVLQDDIQVLLIEAVANERRRQAHLWGPQNHTADRWLVILGEEVGEACQGLLRGDMPNYRDELIQVAAVALAAVTNCMGLMSDPGFVVDALAPPGSKS